jgi:hypothetical protein
MYRPAEQRPMKGTNGPMPGSRVRIAAARKAVRITAGAETITVSTLTAYTAPAAIRAFAHELDRRADECEPLASLPLARC